MQIILISKIRLMNARSPSRDDPDTASFGDTQAMRDGPASVGKPLAPRSISSSELLGGQLSVTIDHEGMCYVLRATRAGKLILTK
ncbi:hemin uptake protein HemP [Parazoarcus communis]